MAYKTIQLLRNSSVITEKGTHDDVHAAALAKLNEILGASTTLDGQPVLVRYKDGTSAERTILGIKGSTANEIFDNVAGNDAITTAITNLIGGADTGFDTLGEIQDKIEDMDLAQVGGSDGDVITAVSEADGQVSASKSSLSGIKLTGYAKTNDTGDIIATDTVTMALSRLENQIGQNSVSSADKTVTIDASGATTDLAVNIDSKTIVKNSTTGVLSSGLSIAKETTGLESNVKEQYKLVDADGNAISGAQVIKIYKDSALVDVFIGHVDDVLTNADSQGESVDTNVTSGTGDTALVYIMQLANGKYKLAAVNVESFLEESEFKNGLQVVNHEVSVKKDIASGKVRIADAPQSGEDTGLVDVLTVSSDGVKVDNIQAAINYAVSTATDALDFADTAETHKFVTEVDESNGVISVQRAQPAAAGITVADSSEYFIATNVEGALSELARFDCGTY